MSQDKDQRSTRRGADRFVERVNDSGFWLSIDLRICAIRCGRRWTNLVTRGFLDHRAPGSVPRYSVVDRGDLRAWQVVLPVADLPDVVHGIANGSAKLGRRTVRYIGRSSRPAEDMTYSFNDLAASYRSVEYDSWSCHALVGYGSSMWKAVEEAGHDPAEIDSMIRSGPNAYDGLADLSQKFFERHRELEIGRTSTVIELIAPLAVRFRREKTTSSLERVTVALRAAAEVFVKKTELVWTVGTLGEPFRHGSAKVCERKWADDGDTLHLDEGISVRKGDATATLFILLGGRCVDSMSVPLAGSNNRIRAHDAVDPSPHQFFEELRSEKWSNAKEFEAAVGFLFFFFGFHVDPLHAHPKLGAAVDQLAHDPASSTILTIECTVGTLDGGGKLGKLVARSEDLRRKLPDSDVIAVLTTARQRTALSEAEVEKAALDDVVPLAREDLHELWDAAQAGENSTHVVRRLRNKLIEEKRRRATQRSLGLSR